MKNLLAIESGILVIASIIALLRGNAMLITENHRLHWFDFYAHSSDFEGFLFQRGQDQSKL